MYTKNTTNEEKVLTWLSHTNIRSFVAGSSALRIRTCSRLEAVCFPLFVFIKLLEKLCACYYPNFPSLCSRSPCVSHQQKLVAMNKKHPSSK